MKNKQPIKLEASITTKYVMPWSRRYRSKYPNHLIEVKVVRKGSLLVSQFEEGQLHTLRSGTTHKIVDTGSLNPADVVSVHGIGLIAIWYEPHQTLCFIDVKDYDEKPLGIERAIAISKHYYALK